MGKVFGSREDSGLRSAPERLALVVFVLLGLLSLGAGVLTFQTAQGYLAARGASDRFERLHRTLDAYLQSIIDAETGQRGFLLTGSEEYLEPLRTGVAALHSREEALRRFSNGHPRLRASLAALFLLRREKVAELEKTVALMKSGDRTAALRIVDRGEGARLMGQIRRRVARIEDRQEANMRESSAMSESRADRTVRGLVAFLLLFLLLLAVFSFLFFRFAREHRTLLALLGREAGVDALTGLPNRNFLMGMLELSMARAARGERSLGLLFHDLDGFKEINDRLGHAAGDRVLIEVAARFSRTVRPGDLVARLGGDEFVVLMPDMSGPEEAGDLASRQIGSLESPVMVSPREVSVSSSVGIAIFPEDGTTPKDLLSSADRAMYRAKARGSGQIVFCHDPLLPDKP